MPLYYDWNFMVGLVFTVAWLWLAEYHSSWFWFKVAMMSVANHCWQRLLESAFRDWRQQPVVHLNNAAPANGNAAQLQRGRLRNLPDTRGMLVDVFQCLPRVGLDACQLVSRQFHDAVEDARTTLPLYPTVVSLRPSMLLVEYAASIVDVGSVAGHFFTGLRRCDVPYFRNAAISLRAGNATYARTGTDMISAFVRWLNWDDRNVHFTHLECEAYADELEDLFRFTDRYNIRSMHIFYKRSLVTPGCDFLSMLFGMSRKRQLSRLTVSLAGVKAKNCGVELQVGLQVLSEIFQDQERPSAERLSIIVPRLKGFRLLRRIDQAYARGEITRPLTIGCDASVSLPELWPENGFLASEEHSPPNGPADARLTMKLTTDGETNFYEFSLPC
ncbi:hypothetical protein AAVH_18288 [Aphelenchoides avenae]|nr:hypothetical protein AAVH_18288 [Aphelenchus avenae]